MRKALSIVFIRTAAIAGYVLLNSSVVMADEIVTSADASVANLRCEDLVDPVGIDIAKPRLSWQMRSDRNGAAQTAYQVLCATDPELLEDGTADLCKRTRVGTEK